MRKRVSIKDVAREAGVSVTTTSYVLNQKSTGRISEETAQKVLKVAERLNYVPNISARTMISQKSQLIGAIIPQTGSSRRLMFDNPFYGEFLSAVESEVRERGYHLLVSGTGPNQDYSSIAQMRNLDGIIILGTYHCEYLDEIKKTGIPVVLVDAYVQDHYFHTVSINDRHGGYLATKYLVEKGHRKIAFVAEKLRGQGVYEQRFLGYCDALTEAGLRFDEASVYATDVSYYGSFQVAEEFVQRNNGETAAFVAADIMALGFINGLGALNWSVPDDLSVIGFDDVYLATMCLPEITTVHQDISEKGRQAVDIVIKAMEDKNKRDVILPLHIVERGSVKNHVALEDKKYAR
ncbi:MAG: LacI family transcriptional regulator [Limnochordia bacterium]|nr:LacI family transcriptional regulator [Limnochordia bacterium]